ncbi:MAG: PEP-CTERM sorting domain-containing protein, partial [Gemmataceae bacterium]
VGGTAFDTDSIIATYTFVTGHTGLQTFGSLQIDVTSLALVNGDELVLSRSSDNLLLTFTPVPEPVAMLALCGLVMGGVVARRKTRQKDSSDAITATV